MQSLNYDVKGVEELAKIPSREELLGRLFGSWKSPVSNFARVINQIAEKTPEGGTAADAVAPAEEKTEAPAEEVKAEEAKTEEAAPADAAAPEAEETKTEEDK